ncbi:MAG: Rpn family recombination-promoting nuclease/putative transposase [Roseburia sp.]|nr:Rpn family recombination-promoting nuclease/putative transposase [Roseburia sp.]
MPEHTNTKLTPSQLSPASAVKTKFPHRRLEDLNLLDDFLFRQMLLQEDISEEFCRILLSTILGKPIRKVRVVPQKEIPGIDTHQHGIRMDAYIKTVPDDLSLTHEASLDAEVLPAIYDIEPNTRYEKETLPRRMRYYHGLIDTQLLASDMSYRSLPEVVIITILPYDPFGKNRMVYTIQNQCLEETSLPYDDGAKKIFLYTRGTKGNPSQELCDMLKYLEETTAKNVTNQDIAAVESLVNKVKRRKEVSISYMKSWELEQMIRDEATQEGLQKGRQIGKEEARQEDIKIFIETCREFGASKEDTALKLAEKYHLSADDIQNYMENYWT